MVSSNTVSLPTLHSPYLIRYVRVAINTLVPSLAESYTYSVPHPLGERIQPGSAVLVPFGNRILSGYVVELLDQPDHSEVKEIYHLVDASSFFRPPFLEFLKWMADYYGVSLGSVFHTALPNGIFEQSQRVLHPTRSIEEMAQHLPALEEDEKAYLVYISQTAPEFGKEYKGKNRLLLRRLLNKGLVKVVLEWSSPLVRIKTKRWIRLLPKEPGKLTPRQKEILELLKEKGEFPLDEFIKLSRSTLPTLKKFAEAGILQIYDKEELRNPFGKMEIEAESSFQLTPHQQSAIEHLLEQLERLIKVKTASKEDFESLSPNLLFGVTGSGKTEVYLQIVQRVLEAGMDALVLVPAIALTSQIIARFRARFKEKVAVLHSHLSAGERFDQWRRIRNGEAKIAIGARSALFAPFNNLGIIIVDEEHETSFKQNSVPRYDTRQAVLRRAEIEKAMVIMGSATPRIESFYLTQKGMWNLLELPHRVMDRELPQVTVVDMKEELASGNYSIFSRKLKGDLQKILTKKEQAILMINRRGFSTFIQCRRCGFVAKCPHCSISLVYHQEEKCIKCHYCNHIEEVPSLCPECNSSYIRYFGLGTQKVEAELKKLFPEARIARMDQDATRTKNAHWSIIQRFKKHETDILIGTQMVAKGFDFPKVSLVGVLSADLALNFPDYAASERTFQLLSQVAGRAGRGETAGEVIIQTYTPNHPSIAAAKTHDYLGFYTQEIQEREILRYPPFTQLTNIVLLGPNERTVLTFSEKFYQRLSESLMASPEITVLGPAPATHAKLRGNYRYQILVKDPSFSKGRQWVLDVLKTFKLPANCRIQVDIDPTDLL